MLIFDKFFVKKAQVPEPGGTYIEGGVGEIHSLIPILKQSEAEEDISKLIFSSLIKYNDKREVIGDLAEKWEISGDGKTYTFHLKEAKWQDGAQITSEDVVFTISLIQNEQTKSPFFESFRDIEVKKIDEKTVSFVLKNSLSPFMGSLTVPILPQHLFAPIPPSKLSSSQYVKKPIGSGPFKLEKIEKNQKGASVILDANENYAANKPYLKKFVFKIYQTQDDLEEAAAKKQIMGFLEDTNENNTGYKMVLPQYMAAFFNLNSPSLNKDFRKALALSVNKEEILSSVSGAEKIDFPILPGFLGYKENERWNFDLEKAKSYFVKSKNTAINLVLLTTQDENNQKIAEILKRQWEALGIQIEVDVKTNALLEKAISERAYDILLIGINQKADSDPYPFWHSSQSKDPGLNLSVFKNKEVDKLLEEARQSMDQNFRKQRYEKFIDIIQSEVPAIFLYQPIYSYQINGKIIGLGNILGVQKSDRFWNVENWYIKTKKVKI